MRRQKQSNGQHRVPRAPRQEYSSGAVLFAGNRQLTCRLINIAASGVLLYAADELSRGTFLRINLTLPGVDQVLDVDGVVARTGTREGHILLGIRFLSRSEEFKTLLATFLKWAAEKREKKARRKVATEKRSKVPTSGSARPRPAPTGAHPARPLSRAEQLLERQTTGPHFPRVSTARLTARVPTLTPPNGPVSRAEQQRNKAQVEERWRQREREARKQKKLRSLYRDALQELERETTTRLGTRDK